MAAWAWAAEGGAWAWAVVAWAWGGVVEVEGAAWARCLRYRERYRQHG